MKRKKDMSSIISDEKGFFSTFKIAREKKVTFFFSFRVLKEEKINRNMLISQKEEKKLHVATSAFFKHE